MSIRQLESGLKHLNVNDENEAPQPAGLKSKVGDQYEVEKLPLTSQ